MTTKSEQEAVATGKACNPPATAGGSDNTHYLKTRPLPQTVLTGRTIRLELV